MKGQAAYRLAVGALVAAALGAGLSAQSQGASAGAPNLSGVWNRLRCLPKNSDVCPDITRAGQERVLTARAKAFRDAFDELAAPKYDCGPARPPALLTDPYPFQIEQLPDRVILQYEKDDVVRTVWLEGHGHQKPEAGAFFAQGYSIGRYDRDQLIVETTRFAFDPQGLDDDFGSLPSSTRKTMVERYARSGDRLRVELTVEDPVFLVAPLTYTLEGQVTTDALLPWDCDVEASQRNLGLIPTEYPTDPPIRPAR